MLCCCRSASFILLWSRQLCTAAVLPVVNCCSPASFVLLPSRCFKPAAVLQFVYCCGPTRFIPVPSRCLYTAAIMLGIYCCGPTGGFILQRFRRIYTARGRSNGRMVRMDKWSNGRTARMVVQTVRCFPHFKRPNSPASYWPNGLY